MARLSDGSRCCLCHEEDGGDSYRESGHDVTIERLRRETGTLREYRRSSSRAPYMGAAQLPISSLASGIAQPILAREAIGRTGLGRRPVRQ